MPIKTIIDSDNDSTFSNGKVIKMGHYRQGKPIGNWSFSNIANGQEIINFNFDSMAYTKSDTTYTSFKSQQAVKQDANIGEWFLTFLPELNKNRLFMPFNSNRLENELLSNIFEIPHEIFNNYVSIEYLATFNFKNGIIDSLDIRESVSKKDLAIMPTFSFIVSTNKSDKLKKVKLSMLSKSLLRYKIREALITTGPWKGKNNKYQLRIPYVINQLYNRNKVLDRY